MPPKAKATPKSKAKAADKPKEAEDKLEIKQDSKTQQAFIDFYTNIEDPTNNNLFRFFQRPGANDKSYFTAHGMNAVEIARNYEKTLAALRFWPGSRPEEYPKRDNEDVRRNRSDEEWMGKGLPYVTLTPVQFDRYLRDLLTVKGKKVELWTNTGGNKWACEKSGSPGNLQGFEDLLLGTYGNETPVVMAIQLAQKDTTEVGMAFINTSLRKIYICSFMDNDQYSILESLIVQIGAKEACMHIETNSFAHAKIVDVLKRSDVVVSEVKKSYFKVDNIEQDLKRLLHADNNIVHNLPELEVKHIMGPAACLIHYLDLITDENNHGYYRLAKFDIGQFMKLDSSAVKALNLVPQATDTNKSMNLFGLLNHCKTGMGSRRLMQWIRQPLLNVAKITERQDLVSVFIEDTVLRKTLQDDYLKKIPDIDRLVKRFQKLRANLEDLVKLYQFVIRISDLQAVFQNYEGDEKQKELLEQKYISNLATIANDFVRFVDLVETTIDLEAAQRNEYLINSEIDAELGTLKTDLLEMEEAIEQAKDEANEALGVEAKLDRNKQFGHHLVISTKDEKTLRSSDTKYIPLQTATGKHRYTTTDFQELSDDYKEISGKYEAKQNHLVEQCVKIAASFITVMESLTELVAEVDILVSFAHQSCMAKIPYERPKVISYEDCDGMNPARIDLKQARHPCLENQDIISLNASSFIANDVSLVQGKSDFMIITGPNMGGKSTYIRMIGVITLMAQIGCFIPCAEGSVVTTRDCILARVGASDSQFRGISTFMAEMLETATILNNATENSLIIIDELGRGTSTFDGFGLAWAISEHIITEKKSMTVFATHFHELTALGDEGTYPNVANMHVVADTTENTILMRYKLEDGPCSQSFGIHVAQLAKFPEEVVKVAKRKVEELENAAESEGETKKLKLSEAFMRDTLREFCLIRNDENRDERLTQLKTKIDKKAEADEDLQEALKKIRAQ